MLDESQKTRLKHIRDKAMEHAEKCVEDECLTSAGEWIDIAVDADHILRKHEMPGMEKRPA